MKPRFLPILLLLITASAFGGAVHAQSGPYGNEWIDFGKTYYKFKVGQTGLCRIYRPALTAAGVPSSVTGANFSLYRDGKEVPVWLSADIMGSGDYIEFWAKKADGLLDRELYSNAAAHPDDRMSLFTDTACYYLTYDGNANHLRYVQSANNIPSGPVTPEAYWLNTVGIYPRNKYVQGPSLSPVDPSEELVSSMYESGEGFVQSLEGIGAQLTANLSAPNLVAGVAASLRASIITRSYRNYHQVKMLFNNNQQADEAIGISQTKHFSATIPAGQLASANVLRFVAAPQGSGYDNYGLSMAELDYPRNFDMAGITQAAFTLPATGSAQYIECTNLGAAKLYDVDGRKWYDGNTSVAGKTRFYLDAAFASRQMIVVADAAVAMSLTPMKTVRFPDYASAANQGNFILISHNQLMQPVGGRSFVQEYGSYRSSAAGGAHSVVTAEITDLYDQFAYGYDMHPLSIQHFLKYAYDKWSTKPADVLLVGRGLLYSDNAQYHANRGLYTFPVVPTYGVPGSDVKLVMFGDEVPRMRIGRLSVWNASEVGTYLSKVQAFEAAILAPPAPTAATEIWKKRAMHVAGATSQSLQDQTLLPALNAGASIIRDTFTGKIVTTIAKSTNRAVDLVNSATVDSLLRNGLSLITFYGHASIFSFDYNLPAPESYTSGAKLPFFTALGCDVAQMFSISAQKSLAERYILANNSGAIGFLASDNVSYTGFDDGYLYHFYESIASKNYSAPMGAHYNYTTNNMMPVNQPTPNFYSAQLESMIFAGDPALRYFSPLKPDYHIGADGLASIPGNVSTSLDSFRLRITSFNLGKSIADTVLVKIEHINPKGVVKVVDTYSIRNLRFSDTAMVTVPINKIEDLGLNKYRVSIDASGKYDEGSEMNNVAVLDLFIYSDNLVPVFPKEFAIVHQQGVVLKASTLNPFRKTGRYKLELDTTELFNSPLKQSTTVSSAGGVVKWTPGIQYTDSVVYYWRTTLDSTANGNYQWANSSFIYLANGAPGWNQSHYFQYQKDNSANLKLDNDRLFKYGTVSHKLELRNMVIGGTGNENADGVNVRNYWDDVRIEQSSYVTFNALQIMAIDSLGKIWKNVDGGSYGAPGPAATFRGLYSREYNLNSAQSRIAAARFLDTIPQGYYVIVKNVWWHNRVTPAFIDSWKADSTITGPGKTLYHALYNLGFTKIDSFNRERVFIFLRQKGISSFPLYQVMTDSLTQYFIANFNIKGSDSTGIWNSTVVGPSSAWQSLLWKTSAYDTLQRNDTASVSVIGIAPGGTETSIYRRVKQDTSLAGISAQQFPKLRLIWHTKDEVNSTSTQLRYWRVLYTPLPEAALNPAAHYAFSDSLAQGQMQTFSSAIENLTELPMDSMLVRYKVIGADGVTRLLGDRRYRPLKALDTLHASITFDPAAYPGSNFLFVEANPAEDQPEEYHPNNLGYLPFSISVDNYNPLLDVTFDGAHILNGDIVSAKPFIKVRLKDENSHLKLNDTGLLRLYLRYPPDPRNPGSQPQTVEVPFDGSRCRFIPASGEGNDAMVEFKPVLSDDGTYQLSVTGADKSHNVAGGNSGSNTRSTYYIEFKVDNKPGITNVLNYPNPFSTATAFVFTLTGSQIPSQLKIQILSVTGKVVREITREELGPLRIGRNITEYQWDGRDQYGQLLGNGVYLYRVVTSLNGQDIELRQDAQATVNRGNGIDKYFKNGYGKMYIMR